MALKQHRQIFKSDTRRVCTTTGSAGEVAVYTTNGSGVGVGARAGSCAIAANPSGYKPGGMLVFNVVDVDTTRYRLNQHNGETLINERCELVREGVLTTNEINGTPAQGDTAYLTTNGQLTPTVSAQGGTVATPKVGQFRGPKDENGYAEVEINLPIV